jgi:hypothetical protein
MLHWTLEEVRDLDADDYSELVQWLVEEAEKAAHPPDPDGSIDMDAVIGAQRRTEEG